MTTADRPLDCRSLLNAAGLSIAGGTVCDSSGRFAHKVGSLRAGSRHLGLGGGIWDDVAERLRRAGHRVFTRTLSGVGERCHLANPALGFDTHAVDLANAIDFEDLRDIILVCQGFSGA